MPLLFPIYLNAKPSSSLSVITSFSLSMYIKADKNLLSLSFFADLLDNKEINDKNALKWFEITVKMLFYYDLIVYFELYFNTKKNRLCTIWHYKSKQF